jgi:hypothetical protein
MPELDYSLWLMPEDTLQTTLTALITDIAKQHNAFAFPAHITLLGNVHGTEQQVLAHAQELATSTTSFPVTLTEVDTTPEFYRALFIRVTLSTELTQFYEHARQIFQFDPQREYRPHLSLLYSNLSHGQKDEIIASIQPQLHDLPHTFVVRKLHLYTTDGPIESWQPIGSFPLNVQTR